MPEPFNYTSQLADLPSPQAAFMTGFTDASKIREAQQKNEKEKRDLAAQVQMQADLGKVYQDPTVNGINSLMVKYPQFADKFKPALESLTQQQKDSRIQQANNIFMPLLHGDRETAIQQLKLQEDAARNSGDKAGENSIGMMRKLVESAETGKAGDNLVIASVGSFLSAAMGEKEFAKTYEAIGKEKRSEDLAPALLATAEAEAKIKANEAQGIMPPKFVETETGIMQWDTTEGKLVPSGYKPVKKSGVNISMGTPQFAVEESTGQQVIYQPSANGEVKIIRGLRPVTDQTKESGKEAAKFEKLSNVIDIARKTIKDASGSLLGAGAAGVARAAGYSTSTSKANAKLKALQAAMMMNMPRMEGPQSDKDVELYREQAGRIGDPTAPIDDRMAALDVLAELMDRYRAGKTPSEGKKDKGATSVDDLLKALGHGGK